MTREEYIKRFIHPEDQLRVRQSQKANAKRPTFEPTPDLEIRIIRRDGEIRHIVVRKTVVRDGSGSLIRNYGINQDITDRKLAEQEREKLISELEKALREVNTLSGLIPICASCKKIRDDAGYWENLENYISSHSQAQFSHGICPECTKKLYPGLFDP